MNFKIFLLVILMLICMGYFISEINKYKKGKSNKYTIINVLLYSLCLIMICLLTVLKIFSTEYCICGIILLNLVSNFIEYKLIKKVTT
jgi:hypothetical protein